MASLVEEQKHSDRRINRIVLYIDDLDRCSEELVVQVKQSVHLMLAFPLLVVMVAVDARWMFRSLAHRFPGPLTTDRADNLFPDGLPKGTATPDDYLEQIFQIPFWLRPPSEQDVMRMLEGLIGGAAAPAAPQDVIANLLLPPGEISRSPVFKRRQHDSTARSLDIQPEERHYIKHLAPLLNRSSRAVKRFVNVRGLLKASRPREKQDTFLNLGGPLGAPHRPVLLLLAVVNGLPTCSDALLEALLVVRPGTPVPAANLGTRIANVQARYPATKEEADHLTALLDRDHPVAWRGANLADVHDRVSRVAHYSYQMHSEVTVGISAALAT